MLFSKSSYTKLTILFNKIQGIFIQKQKAGEKHVKMGIKMHKRMGVTGFGLNYLIHTNDLGKL